MQASNKRFNRIFFGALLAFAAASALLSMIPAAHAGPGPLTFYGGESVSNSLNDLKASAWGLDQTVWHSDRVQGVFGYLNEGHVDGSKRDGIYALVQLTHQFTPALATGFVIGPYVTADTQTTGPGTYRDVYGLALQAGLNARYALTSHLGVVARWIHVMTFHSRDADVFVSGASLRY